LSSLRAVLRDEEVYDYSLSEIVSKYLDWVRDDKYMILNRVQFKDFRIRDSRKNRFISYRLPIKSDYFAIKCSKRGNDVYRSRVYRQFKDLVDKAEKLVFFNPKDRGQKRTRALWVTLTYDPKLCGFKEAWAGKKELKTIQSGKNKGKQYWGHSKDCKCISCVWNSFMSKIRKLFGNVSCSRVFESYKSGHPHIHCILLFEEKEFKVFRDKKGQFRVKEKDMIASCWHSFVDVKAMYSLGKSFSYLKKYLLKSIDAETKDSLALKTLALCWLFCKRAFSVSGKFRQMLTDLIKTKHNSNQKTKQTTLKGEIIQEYIYYILGFVPADIVRLKKDAWFSKLSNEQIISVEKFLETKKCFWD